VTIYIKNVRTNNLSYICMGDQNNGNGHNLSNISTLKVRKSYCCSFLSFVYITEQGPKREFFYLFFYLFSSSYTGLISITIRLKK